MLIHLSTVAGTPLVSIDPEGGPIPLIESIASGSDMRTTFRLSFPSVDDWKGFDVPSGGAARPFGPMHNSPPDRPESVVQEKGRLWRYGGMSLAFATMLVLGMVISTVLHNLSGTGAGSGAEMGSAAAAALARPGTRPSPVTFRQPSSRNAAAPSTRQAPYEVETGSVAQVTPQVSTQPAPQPAPMPTNPGALFGLHS